MQSLLDPNLTPDEKETLAALKIQRQFRVKQGRDGFSLLITVKMAMAAKAAKATSQMGASVTSQSIKKALEADGVQVEKGDRPEHIFNKFSEGNDTVDFDQFCDLMNYLGSEMTEDEVEEAMIVMDPEADGDVSLKAFKAWISGLDASDKKKKASRGKLRRWCAFFGVCLVTVRQAAQDGDC